MRKFETGATRDSDENKLDFEGFLSPTVLKRYAEYMHSHRKQADGNLRDSDNWQKGIPKSAYMKSMWRHFFEVWEEYRGVDTKKTFNTSKELHKYIINSPDMEDRLCALLFNVMGMLHEELKNDTLKEKP